MKLKKKKIILRLKEISKKNNRVTSCIWFQQTTTIKSKEKYHQEKKLFVPAKSTDTVNSLHLKSNSAPRLRTEIGPHTKQNWKYSS